MGGGGGLLDGAGGFRVGAQVERPGAGDARPRVRDGRRSGRGGGFGRGRATAASARSPASGATTRSMSADARGSRDRSGRPARRSGTRAARRRGSSPPRSRGCRGWRPPAGSPRAGWPPASAMPEFCPAASPRVRLSRLRLAPPPVRNATPARRGRPIPVPAARSPRAPSGPGHRAGDGLAGGPWSRDGWRGRHRLSCRVGFPGRWPGTVSLGQLSLFSARNVRVPCSGCGKIRWKRLSGTSARPGLRPSWHWRARAGLPSSARPGFRPRLHRRSSGARRRRAISSACPPSAEESARNKTSRPRQSTQNRSHAGRLRLGRAMRRWLAAQVSYADHGRRQDKTGASP